MSCWSSSRRSDEKVLRRSAPHAAPRSADSLFAPAAQAAQMSLFERKLRGWTRTGNAASGSESSDDSG
ncbi:hypothetical protein DIPPA_23767 [Diplonema papillatum]|nr:hypothetical protein DIPPA_23767 [Diplonema papillatum]